MLRDPFGATLKVRELCFFRPRLSFALLIYWTVILDGAQKANQVFLPVLENAEKAQKLRTTLSVFERSKFFFNLPNFILESIEAVRLRTRASPYCIYPHLPTLGSLRNSVAGL